jgi:hypothetical protein
VLARAAGDRLKERAGQPVSSKPVQRLLPYTAFTFKQFTAASINASLMGHIKRPVSDAYNLQRTTPLAAAIMAITRFDDVSICIMREVYYCCIAVVTYFVCHCYWCYFLLKLLLVSITCMIVHLLFRFIFCYGVQYRRQLRTDDRTIRLEQQQRYGPFVLMEKPYNEFCEIQAKAVRPGRYQCLDERLINLYSATELRTFNATKPG